MNDDMKEKLSALADNELDELEERRVLAALADDAALRNTWERYHLARAALTQDLEFVVTHDVTERVARQIAAEPSIAAGFRRRRMAQFMGTFAIAASVAAIAIAGVQWLQQPPPPPLNTTVAMTKVAVNTPVQVKDIHSGVTRWDTKEPEAESALNAYLVEHNEYASTAGIGGIMMPYIRVVSYDDDK